MPHSTLGARLARHRMIGELADIVSPALLNSVSAVVTELVANAVRHAAPLPGQAVQVTWRLRSDPNGDVVQIQVTDGGAPGQPHLRPMDPEATDGRGLSIVAALARRWGVKHDGLGQSVWAEVS
ncbi:MAG TPA: ATP-binding protein [Micromonosporaceae bacterium]